MTEVMSPTIFTISSNNIQVYLLLVIFLHYMIRYSYFLGVSIYLILRYVRIVKLLCLPTRYSYKIMMIKQKLTGIPSAVAHISALSSRPKVFAHKIDFSNWLTERNHQVGTLCQSNFDCVKDIDQWQGNAIKQKRN